MNSNPDCLPSSPYVYGAQETTLHYQDECGLEIMKEKFNSDNCSKPQILQRLASSLPCLFLFAVSLSPRLILAHHCLSSSQLLLIASSRKGAGPTFSGRFQPSSWGTTFDSSSAQEHSNTAQRGQCDPALGQGETYLKRVSTQSVDLFLFSSPTIK